MVILNKLVVVVLGGHPVLSGHHSIPRECPLNTGFTVLNSCQCQICDTVSLALPIEKCAIDVILSMIL